MKRAEKMIRQQISELTIDRIAPKKVNIEQAIQFMYWQGTFRQKKYLKMNQLLQDKYTQLMDDYERDLKEKTDRDFDRLMEKLSYDLYK